MTAIRYSKQRELIYNNLKSRYDHPTAEVIYADLKLNHPELSLGTVYRNLNFLCESNLIRKIDTGKSVIHYDADLSTHYHFTCDKCHQVYDIVSDKADDIAKVIQDESSHHVNNVRLSFSGICLHCQTKEN